MGWSEIQLDRPHTGLRLFRYSANQHPTGRPQRIEVYSRRGWVVCPNADVSDAVMKAAGLGR